MTAPPLPQMVTLGDRRLPVVFAWGVALLLVMNPFYLFPHAGQPVYTHDIEQVSASAVPPEADVLQYATLSRAATAAIRDARHDDGIVYGAAKKPPEFFYSDYAHLNKGIYYIQQNGRYYRLTTYAGGGLFPIDLFLRWGLIGLGLGIAVVGYISLRDRRWWLPIGSGLYGLVVLVTAVGQPGRGMVIGVDSGPALLVTLLGTGAVWVGIGATAGRALVWRAIGVLGSILAVSGGLWLVQSLPIGDLPIVPATPLVLLPPVLLLILIGSGYLGHVAYRQVGKRLQTS